MHFVDAVKSALSQYASGTGRARRSKYWQFVLFTGVVGLAAGLLDILASTQLISAVAILALLVPSIAVSLRRLHDTDRSGWMYLLVLIPLVGPILMLVFFVSEGTAGPNRFGPSPKALAA